MGGMIFYPCTCRYSLFIQATIHLVTILRAVIEVNIASIFMVSRDHILLAIFVGLVESKMRDGTRQSFSCSRVFRGIGIFHQYITQTMDV